MPMSGCGLVIIEGVSLKGSTSRAHYEDKTNPGIISVYFLSCLFHKVEKKEKKIQEFCAKGPQA